jgi:hypothetical protein
VAPVCHNAPFHGGANEHRSWLWKWESQQVADETGLTTIVTHYPTSASKWSWVEHTHLAACTWVHLAGVVQVSLVWPHQSKLGWAAFAELRNGPEAHSGYQNRDQIAVSSLCGQGHLRNSQESLA